MNIPKIIDKNYYFGLDTLRALSLMLVVLSHIFFNDGSVIDKLHLGAIGVDVFFVISGFLITALICKELAIKGEFNLKSFLIRRAFRILPVVCMFSVVLISLNFIYNLNLSFISIASGLLFVKNLPFFEGIWENGHLWSLSVEEQFYIIFPVGIYVIGTKRYLWTLCALLFIIPYFSFWYYDLIIAPGVLHDIIGVLTNLLGMGTYMIIIGSIGALLLFKRPSIFDFVFGIKNKSLISAALFFLVILVSTPLMNLSYIPNFLYKIFLGISVLIIILINISAERKNLLFWDNPLLVYFGKLSYSLYIWQQLFTHNQPWGGGILINLICMLLVSMISYHFVEQKFIGFRKSLGY
jgi:peptidoglycan/LPS O-acetylase OafA/YrhL